MKCPNCQRDNEPGNRFCMYCGTRLPSPDEAQSQQPERASEPTREEIVSKWQRQYERDAREGKKPVTGFVLTDFRKALLATAVPISVLAVIAAFGLVAIPYQLQGTFIGLGLAAGGLWVAAIIAGIVFSVRRKGEIASGVFTGVGIGFAVAIVAMTVTCFAVIGRV